MTAARSNITENPIDDGDCAFAALVLGLSQESVLTRIEQIFIKKKTTVHVALYNFICEAAEAFHLAEASWDLVKKKMIALRQSNHYQDKQLLQKKLAPILRLLAVELIYKNIEVYKENIETRLLDAFNNPTDDMFRRHESIRNTFASLEHHPNALAELKKRWNNEGGLHEFLNDMASSKQWAGDLELVPLAEHFHINLVVTMPRFGNKPYGTRYANGCLSIIANEGEYQLNDKQRHELVHRNIVDENNSDAHLFLKSMTAEMVESRLSAMPDREQILAYLDNNKPNKQTPVPDDLWSVTIKQELCERNIITIDSKNPNHYVFARDFSDENECAEAKERMDEIEGKDAVKTLWQEHYLHAPTITLSNPHGCHWYHLLPATAQSNAINTTPTLLQFVPEKELLQANKWQQFADTLLAHLPADSSTQFVSLEKYIQKNDMDVPIDLTNTDVAVGQQVLSKDMYVDYELAGKTVVVDRLTQELLDRELAKKLQAEVVDRLTQELLDHELAKKLQAEIDDVASARGMRR